MAFQGGGQFSSQSEGGHLKRGGQFSSQSEGGHLKG